MASGNAESLTKARPVLDALGKEVHIIEGGAGFGSTVKCVHQLLAGVHICAAAEAMAMAAKAGLDVEQLYRIVNGAAGASWMFTDRGQRMLSAEADVKSALDIFVKDLDIVYSEAKAIKCPIPLASVALQQFISGQCLGLGKSDDSQVVKVYERITSVSVLTKNKNH
jgi:putative dehydrogenase